MTTYEPGSVIAGYRIDSLIGRGGMAVVYRAEDMRLGRKVALKLLSPQLADNEQFRQRFIQESRLAASLDHPNIVPIYEAGEADGQLYIAMRYVVGPDLKGLLADQGGRLPLEWALRLFGQIGDALDSAHRAGLVHRDVKPANILVAESQERPGDARGYHAYLTDFGLTKRTSELTGGLTGTGHFLGTVDYVSPEQIQGKPVGPGTDIYALGCVLYECLTGQPPFRRDDDAALLWAHLVETPSPIAGIRPDVPEAVDAVVARAMAKDPADRYGSCEELVCELESALDAAGARDRAEWHANPGQRSGHAWRRRDVGRLALGGRDGRRGRARRESAPVRAVPGPGRRLVRDRPVGERPTRPREGPRARTGARRRLRRGPARACDEFGTALGHWRPFARRCCRRRDPVRVDRRSAAERFSATSSGRAAHHRRPARPRSGSGCGGGAVGANLLDSVDATSVVAEPADSSGGDPFTPPPTPGDAASEPAPPADGGSAPDTEGGAPTEDVPVSGDTVGLYGGTGAEACSAASMATFFDTHPDQGSGLGPCPGDRAQRHPVVPEFAHSSRPPHRHGRHQPRLPGRQGECLPSRSAGRNRGDGGRVRRAPRPVCLRQPARRARGARPGPLHRGDVVRAGAADP